MAFFAELDGGSATGNCLPCQHPCYSCEISEDTCVSCIAGYYLSTSGKCSACAEGCLSCDGDSGCLTCSVGFTKISNDDDIASCMACPSKCSECDQKLVDAEMKNMCRKCENGYTVQEDGSCLSCGQTKKTYGC